MAAATAVRRGDLSQLRDDASGSAAPTAPVADTYWADFLFGTTSSVSAGQLFVAHLRQTLDSAYAQDDWKVTSQADVEPGAALGVRIAVLGVEELHLELGSRQRKRCDTITPGAVAGNGITPVTAGGRLRQDADQSGPDRLCAAHRLCVCAVCRRRSIARGFGTGYVHYTRAGSGDILAINAPQAQFAAVTQIKPTMMNQCSTPLPAQIIATGQRRRAAMLRRARASHRDW